MSDQTHYTVPCAICHQPVAIGSKSTKANEAGKAVHEACYVKQLTSEQPKQEGS